MNTSHDLELLIRSRIPIIIIDSSEEQRALSLIKRLVPRLALPLFRWAITEGLQRLDGDFNPQRHNMKPFDVLSHIKAIRSGGIYVLCDFHPYLDDAVHVRLIKDVALRYDEAERTIVFLSHKTEIPEELRAFSAYFDLSLPTLSEVKDIVGQIVREWESSVRDRQVRLDPWAFDMVVRNLMGLTAVDARRLARNVVYHDGAITRADLPRVMEAKYKLLNRNGILMFEYETAKFSDVGGLVKLKKWLEERKIFFHAAADLPPIDPPRGVMLLGVQGCGKSLAAKAAAGIFGVPLLRLDFGALYNKYYGETERNLRESLRTAEVMAPCVLWMDEIEKGLSTGDRDSGVAMRVLGTVLTWMAEKRDNVFLVATANDISALPPELIRKGRFDEIFFVDLPNRENRGRVFSIHLAKRGLKAEEFDVGLLAESCAGFSGAEIEQAVVSAMYSAYAMKETLTTAHLRQEILRTSPLSVVMAEKIEGLRQWATGRTVPCD